MILSENREPLFRDHPQVMRANAKSPDWPGVGYIESQPIFVTTGL
jgi:hypothetical protein